MQRNSLFEILLCAAVVVLAAGFLIFVRMQTGIGTLTSYDIRVELKKADGLASGADVRVFGVKVGKVESLRLDSKHYLADLTLSIRSDMRIPSDSAFQALEAKNPGILNQLTTAPDVATPNSKLAKILTYHVVGTRYDAAGLVRAGTVDSLEGAKITVGGTAAAPTINGAPVLCGNIPTKNATVFVIGQVLSPPAS